MGIETGNRGNGEIRNSKVNLLISIVFWIFECYDVWYWFAEIFNSFPCVI